MAVMTVNLPRGDEKCSGTRACGSHCGQDAKRSNALRKREALGISPALQGLTEVRCQSGWFLSFIT
jgi:hypothetical protein